MLDSNTWNSLGLLILTFDALNNISMEYLKPFKFVQNMIIGILETFDCFAHSVGAVEYTDSFSSEDKTPPQRVSSIWL